LQYDYPHPPQGALRQSDESVVWRVWAPSSTTVSLVTLCSGQRKETVMTLEDDCYFTHRQSRAEDGLRYGYKLADGREYPDPASRWQPEGVHRFSAVFSPQSFPWTDAGWRGIDRDELVIYELHVGAFTPEGTLDAIAPRLPQLAELGVTAVELMPLAQFPGDRNWGYDGVYPYAVQNSYGGPRALQRLVDAAHRAGLAIILDVVYNHFGPEGNYSCNYGPYLTDRYHTPWGMAVNYDGPQSDAVRQFAIDNARMWVRDLHADGLRLDAVQTIYDFGPRHILAEIQAAVQSEAVHAGRRVHVIAESNQNDIRLIRRKKRGGYALDGVWSDDFHHAVHALLSGERDGFYMDFGDPSQVAKAINEVFVYDGCYSPFHRRRHGSRVGRIDRTRFVICVQNHDQVGNRAQGDRLGTLLPPAAQRLACGLLLLSPCVPLLFMGEEYGEQTPFPFFCSFDDPALVEAVRQGRRREFDKSPEFEIPDPQDITTFATARLSWAWPEGSPHSQLRRLYQDLLAARHRWPALRDRRHTIVRLLNDRVSDAPALLAIRRGGEDGLLAVANLTEKTALLAEAEKGTGPICVQHRPGRSGKLDLSPFPLREAILSTEDARYGGGRLVLPSPSASVGEGVDLQLLPYELLVFGSRRGSV
jgi:maltooligosyltrehalose trehalohydrolase